MSEILPPGRGLCYAKPALVDNGPGMPDGPGIECLCDCGLTTIIHLDLDGPLMEPREIAYTCDGCQSVHWLTLYPVADDPA